MTVHIVPDRLHLGVLMVLAGWASLRDVSAP